MITDRTIGHISWIAGLASWVTVALAWTKASNLEIGFQQLTHAGVTPITIAGLILGIIALICRFSLLSNDVSDIHYWGLLLLLGAPFFCCLALIDPSGSGPMMP